MDGSRLLGGREGGEGEGDKGGEDEHARGSHLDVVHVPPGGGAAYTVYQILFMR